MNCLYCGEIVRGVRRECEKCGRVLPVFAAPVGFELDRTRGLYYQRAGMYILWFDPISGEYRTEKALAAAKEFSSKKILIPIIAGGAVLLCAAIFGAYKMGWIFPEKPASITIETSATSPLSTDEGEITETQSTTRLTESSVETEITAETISETVPETIPETSKAIIDETKSSDKDQNMMDKIPKLFDITISDLEERGIEPEFTTDDMAYYPVPELPEAYYCFELANEWNNLTVPRLSNIDATIESLFGTTALSLDELHERFGEDFRMNRFGDEYNSLDVIYAWLPNNYVLWFTTLDANDTSIVWVSIWKADDFCLMHGISDK